MLQLLYFVLCLEGLVAFLLVVKIGPLRELVMRCLDQVKMRKGIVLAAAAIISAILFSNFISNIKIQNKGAKLGTMSSMDQVLWRANLLEASLMGFSLFLGFLIDRMHKYLRKLVNLRYKVSASREEFERLDKEKQQKADKASDEIKSLQKEVSNLTENLKNLKADCNEKDKKVETAEAHVAALHKQAAELLQEYDRLLEENQILQSQAHSYQNN